MRLGTVFRTVGIALLLSAMLPAAACASAEGVTRARPVAAAATAAEPVPSRGTHSSFDAFVSSHASGPAWRDAVWRDNLATSDVILPAALAAGALAVRPWDRSLERHAEGAFGNREWTGDAGQFALIGTAAAAAWLAPGEGRAAEDALCAQAETYALALGTTEILHLAVGRGRPNSSDRGSFPSGHATAAFAAATLIERNSGTTAGVAAYAVAAVTAFSRVESGKHFPSDVLAGAAIGTLAASIVDSLHFGEGGVSQGAAPSRRTTFEIVPTDRGTEVAVVLRF